MSQKFNGGRALLLFSDHFYELEICEEEFGFGLRYSCHIYRRQRHDFGCVNARAIIITACTIGGVAETRPHPTMANLTSIEGSRTSGLSDLQAPGLNEAQIRDHTRYRL